MVKNVCDVIKIVHERARIWASNTEKKKFVYLPDDGDLAEVSGGSRLHQR